MQTDVQSFCSHSGYGDTSHQFGERLLVHVEEHSANGWKDGDLNASCGSGLLVFVSPENPSLLTPNASVTRKCCPSQRSTSSRRIHHHGFFTGPRVRGFHDTSLQRNMKETVTSAKELCAIRNFNGIVQVIALFCEIAALNFYALSGDDRSDFRYALFMSQLLMLRTRQGFRLRALKMVNALASHR